MGLTHIILVVAAGPEAKLEVLVVLVEQVAAVQVERGEYQLQRRLV
jgi:hypothetical protein